MRSLTSRHLKVPVSHTGKRSESRRSAMAKESRRGSWLGALAQSPAQECRGGGEGLGQVRESYEVRLRTRAGENGTPAFGGSVSF